MDIEGTLWRHAVTSSVTSWTSKTLLCNNLRCSFHILCRNEPISNISKFSKWPPFWGSGAFWTGSCTRSWVIYQDRLCHSLNFEILFDVLAQILTELWLFQNLTYFLIWWPNYGIFVRQKLQGSVLWQTIYVDQVWWWLVKNCDLYRGKCDNFI